MTPSNSKKIALKVGFIGAITTSILLVFITLRSTSSTSAVGLILIPFYFVITFIGFFLLGYSLCYIKNWFTSTPRKSNLKSVLTFLISICFVALLFGGIIKGVLLTSTVSKIQKINTNTELENVFNTSFFKHNKFVLGAITQNPVTSGELLDQIAKLDDSSLHYAMGSFFPVLGNNRKGLAVMRLVVLHPNVSVETVEYIADTSQADDVLYDIVKNPKTSIETLRRLETKKNYLVDWGLAQNQKTPPDVFTKLLGREKYFTQQTTLEMLLRNPSISSEIRTKASELLKEY